MKYLLIHVSYLGAIILSMGCENTSKQTVMESSTAKTAYLFISEEKLIFKTDTVTPATSNCIFAYNIGDRRYLSYLNRSRNEIIVFDIDNQRQLFKITPEKEGPNGVGIINGFHIVNFDSIYIAPKSKRSIYVINKNSKIKTTINYGTGGELPSPNPYAFTNKPFVIEKDKIYLPSLPFGNWNTYSSFSEVPVCCVVDVSNNDYKYLAMTYPDGYIKKGKTEPEYSRIRVGDNFIYSFFGDHKIYVTEDHATVRELWAGSDFFDAFVYLKKNSDMQEYSRFRCEAPHYSSITYDANRKVYYRFASLGAEVETNDNLALLSRFPPNTSIIILDSLFHKIGETKLPYGRFNISNYFVTDEGLYVSENNPLNKNYSDENLHFTLLELRYNE